jgi:hypothetical protein
VFIATPRTLKLGTSVPYSDPHTLGTGAIPVREHNVLLEETFETLVRMVGAYVTFPMNEAFGGPSAP